MDVSVACCWSRTERIPTCLYSWHPTVWILTLLWCWNMMTISFFWKRDAKPGLFKMRRLEGHDLTAPSKREGGLWMVKSFFSISVGFGMSFMSEWLIITCTLNVIHMNICRNDAAITRALERGFSKQAWTQALQPNGLLSLLFHIMASKVIREIKLQSTW